jgi:flagella basal body P-ring formation protein FlgA
MHKSVVKVLAQNGNIKLESRAAALENMPSR